MLRQYPELIKEFFFFSKHKQVNDKGLLLIILCDLLKVTITDKTGMCVCA